MTLVEFVTRHGSSRWYRLLRSLPAMRSGFYLSLALKEALGEGRRCSVAEVDKDFHGRRDPWQYESNPIASRRFRDMERVLHSACERDWFASGLEIGCAEGAFTEILAAHCRSLVVADIAPSALERTRTRKSWGDSVCFERWDLRADSLDRRFELVVVAGVLEYLTSPLTFRRVRKKLVGAVEPGGYLMVETTAANPVVEQAWWARMLVRGTHINHFVAAHPELHTVASVSTPEYLITLCRRHPKR